MDFAIVGMACRLPGANSIDEYWELVRAAGSHLGPLPEDRLNRKLYFDPQRGVVGKSYSDLGGVVPSRSVDFNQLPLPDELIEGRDIAHLILCDVAASALRDAGYDPFALRQRNAGVYIGHTGGSPWISDLVYSTIVAEGAQYLLDSTLFRGLGSAAETIVQDVVARVRQAHGARQPKFNLDLSALAGSALISQAFGLRGPYMVVDAACASSLQAMSVGLRALTQGRIDMALVGGCSYCKSDSLVLFSAAQSVSSVGSCPFSAQADGLISSEGYVVLAIKTLEKALADGDRIRSVIRGVGVSSDGKGKSLWAPRKEGQQLAMMRAYGNHIDAKRLQYIEAHATSTQVGDATELEALSETLSQLRPANAPKIPLGSSKGNVGHTLETAGMAGLVKVVLAMQHAVIPPAVGNGELNGEIDWANMPMYVPFKEEAWAPHADGHPRRAAVNAFGIGGLNVHVVLDEFTPSTAPSITSVPRSANADATNDDRAVAVVGAGCIFPGANTLSAFYDLLASGRSALSPAPASRWTKDLYLKQGEAEAFHTYNDIGGFVTDFVYDWRRHKVPPKQIEAANPLQFMLLDAADQAISDAGYREKPFDSTRTAVVVGTSFGGDFSHHLQMGLRLPEFEQTLAEVLRARGVAEEDIAAIAAEFKKILLKKMPALVDETGSFTSSTLASRITKTFNLMGGALALDAGTCSTPFAIQAGVDMLLQSDADMIVCAAGQRSIDAFVFESYSLQGTLSHGHPKAPFDAQNEGFVPGEGCGVIILKRLADARRDGDRIRAVIRGIGSSRHSDQVLASEMAMRQALADAGLPAEAISAVEAYGKGVSQDDAAEIAAIDRVYGQSDRSQPVLVGSLTAQIGSTGGAAGMAELLKLTTALERGSLPATVGFEQSSTALARRTKLRVSGKPESIAAGSVDGYRAAGVHTIHDDMAYHLVVDNGVRVPRMAKPTTASLRLSTVTGGMQPWRIFRWCGNDRANLANQVERSLADVAGTFADSPSFAPNEQWRLAIVADSIPTLTKRLQLAREALKNPAKPGQWDEQGIYLVDSQLPRRKVAALFPGQGSQYPGMLRDLCAVSPAAYALCAEAIEIMSRHGWEAFDDFAWQSPETLGQDVWHTQSGMLIADVMAMHAAQEMGLTPDYLGAHSFGEFGALVASGAWTLEEALLATRARCDAVLACRAGRSTMLSVLESEAKIRQLMLEQPGDVFVCAINGPEQMVVGGSETAVDRFAERCTQLRIKNKRLQVPCAFHTPLLVDTQAPLTAALAQREIHPPRTPLISATSTTFLSDPDAIRSSLVRQMTEPVQYMTHIRRLYDQGVRVFVELGPSQVLTQLNRRILAHASDVYIASIDHPNRTAAEQVIRFQAFLETLALIGPQHSAARTALVVPADTSPVAQSAEAAAPRAIAEAPLPETKPIVVFDATERRRERHRSAGKHAPAAKPTAIKEQAPAAPITNPTVNGASAHANGNGHEYGHANGNSNGKHAHANLESAAAPPQPTPTVTSIAQRIVREPAQVTPPAAPKLEAFLIEFVVEQTGYPAEIVELDADLESDLGIDSIKKAQLFGEIGEQFHLQPDENLSLDDFPTLRHVLAYLEQQPGLNDSASPAVPPAPVRPEPPTVVVAAKPAVTKPTVETQPLRAEASVAVAERPGSSVELESFLINFVVEQTGYPAEIVELDADLEADLGIDSIKKAQLFGEIGEQFHLQPDENLSLDDFPTLRHVLAYLEQQPSVASRSLADEPANAVVASPLHNHSNGHGNGNGNGNGYHSITVEVPVATKAAQAPVELAPTTIGTAQANVDLEAFLINFVVEQTGYPAEIVELDADLEADLGIDSIKKAQLFGEIGEQFHLQADDNLSLDDFPTLRHVLSYLRQHIATEAQPVIATNGIGSLRSETPAPTSPMRSSAYEHAFAQGRANAAAIARLLQDLTAHLTPALAKQIAASAWLSTCTAQERETLRGLAQGAGVLEESLAALQLAAPAVGLLPTGSQQHTSDYSGFALQIAAPTSLVVDDTLRVTLPGLLGAIAGVNGQGVAIAAWSTGAFGSECGALPSGLIVERLLAASSREQAIEMLKSIRVGSSVAITLTDGSADCITVARTNDRGEQVIETTEAWQSGDVNLLGAGSSAETVLAHLARTLQQQSQGTPSALLGQSPRQSAAILWDAQQTVVVTADEVSLAAGQTPAQRVLAHRLPLPSASAAAHSANSITQRYVLRLAEASTPAAAQQIPSPALLIGDTPESQAFATQLRSQGVTVSVIASADTIDTALAAFDQVSAAVCPATLVFFTAREEALHTTSDAAAWNRRRERGMLAPYFVCQRWLTLRAKEAPQARSMLVAVTALGGDFGLSGNIRSPEGGAVAGLLKGLRHEYPQLQVKILDPSPAFATQDLTAALAKELTLVDGNVEIALHPGQRLIPRPAQQVMAKNRRTMRPERGSTWLITGGARGVTAVVARELGRRYGVKLHLLGTTPLQAIDPALFTASEEQLKAMRGQAMVAARQRGDDPIAAWKNIEKTLEIERNLRQLRAEGIDATYHACDVANRSELSALLARVRQQSGPIQGIVHGAGFEAAAKFEKKKRENVERTVSAKNDGAAAILALTTSDPLQYFLGFGSTSGRLGGMGQTDYSMANDLLAKQIDQLRIQRPACRAAVFHWHAWDEVGMAARPESRFALEAFGLKFMPLAEGVEHLIAELEAGLPEPEVLLTEQRLCPDLISPDAGVALAKAPLAAEEPTLQTAEKAAPASQVATTDWSAFLVNFVVEQTGYPAEIVELDADLEADLGIDSIKKAQLFGEIGEQFHLEADDNLSLDDFPTLRHVMRYLEEKVGPGSTTSTTTAVATLPQPIAPSAPMIAEATVSTPGGISPLLDRVLHQDANGTIYAGVLDPIRDVFLREHLMLKRPLLPGVIGLELLAQAAAAVAKSSRVSGLRNIRIHQGMRFLNDDPRDVNVFVRPAGRHWEAELRADFKDRAGRTVDAQRVHVTGTIEMDATMSPPLAEHSSPPFPLNPMIYPDDSPMYHGRAFRRLESLMFQHDGGFGRLRAPKTNELAGERPDGNWFVPGALLDGCLVAVAVYSFLMCGQRVEIPETFEHLEFFRAARPNEVCMLRFFFRGHDERRTTYDFILFGDDQQPILQCQGFSCVQLSEDRE